MSEDSKSSSVFLGMVIGGTVGFIASGFNPAGVMVGANAGRVIGDKLSDDD